MSIKIGEGAAKLNFKNVQTVKESCGSLTVPHELTPFFEPSFLLPGESLHDFEAIRQMMVDDIRPETNIEWLWTLDLVELSWEVLRYRRLKKRILDAHRVAAIETVLQRLDGEGMPVEAMPMVRARSRRAAAEWRDDRVVATEIEARLDRCGFDAIDINAEAIVQARELFDLFDLDRGATSAHWTASGNQYSPRVCQTRPARDKIVFDITSWSRISPTTCDRMALRCCLPVPSTPSLTRQ